MSVPSDSSLVVLSADRLRSYCHDLLIALNVPDAHARIVGDSLIAANLRGVDSHGVQMLPIYIQQLRAGGFDVLTAGRLIQEQGVCLRYDGENGFGQVVADRCTDHAIRVARDLGASITVACHSNHFGAGAWWGEKIARHGFIAIVMSNACPAVPPWQGKTPIFGTNPLCMAIPGTHGHARWLLDMATTTVALGKVGHAGNLNSPTIPLEWGFLDASGQPTSDTTAAQKGLPTPLGRYKGTGLAMMIELLCSGLSGGAMATELPIYRTGGDPLNISHTFIAVDPARFLPPGEFEARADRLVELAKASAPSPGYTEVLVAGEPEWRCEKLRETGGIPVPAKLWAKLASIAAELKVASPRPDLIQSAN